MHTQPTDPSGPHTSLFLSPPQPHYFPRLRLTRCRLLLGTDPLFFLVSSVVTACCKLTLNSFALCRVCVRQSSKQMSILMPVVSDHQFLYILSHVWSCPSTHTSLVLPCSVCAPSLDGYFSSSRMRFASWSFYVIARCSRTMLPLTAFDVLVIFNLPSNAVRSPLCAMYVPSSNSLQSRFHSFTQTRTFHNNKVNHLPHEAFFFVPRLQPVALSPCCVCQTFGPDASNASVIPCQFSKC